MRRYLLAFLAALTVSELLLWGMVLLAFFLWFLDSAPLLFHLLAIVVALLPFPALGRFFGGRPKAARMQKDWRGLLLLLAGVALWSVLYAAGVSIPWLSVLVSPGELIGYVLVDMCGLWNWDFRVKVFAIAGNFLLPPLFHFGWRRGKQASRPAGRENEEAESL